MDISLNSKNMVYNWATMAGRPPESEAPSFGKKLSFLRKSKNLSQQKLANLLETTRSAVDYYERRAQNPTIELINHCAKVLEVSPSYFLDETNTPAKQNKRGPKSQIEQRLEKINKLPKSKQKEILNVVDALLAQAS